MKGLFPPSPTKRFIDSRRNDRKKWGKSGTNELIFASKFDMEVGISLAPSSPKINYEKRGTSEKKVEQSGTNVE